MAFDSAIFILDLFTDLSVYCGTISYYIKIGIFADSPNLWISSARFLIIEILLAIMRLSDCGTTFPFCKNSSARFYPSRFYAFNICSKDFQNNDFSPFLSINLLKIK